MNLWTPADVSLPVFRSNVDLLEYAINNIDTLGMLHATAQPEAFELRTGFLDDYQRKEPGPPVGATVAAKSLHVDERRANCIVMDKVAEPLRFAISLVHQNIANGRASRCCHLAAFELVQC
jgi:hypothetical protein